MTITFEKYSGCGNDFIIVKGLGNLGKAEVAKLCSRKKGIGADGLLAYEPSKVADAKMRIFNADGSEAEMCGNGIRCFVDYCIRHGLAKHESAIETLAGNLKAIWHSSEKIDIAMPPPHSFKNPLQVEALGSTFSLASLNTGVPHALAFVDRLNDHLRELGKAICHHPLFQPAGTNFSLVKVVAAQHLMIRTYERGVEEETESCATAATAAAFAAAKIYGHPSPITVTTPSGSCITICFNSNFENIVMSGPATFIYAGVLNEFLLY